ncbi:MAG: PepSY-associated TM helix domain-containing protein [Gammaproteobacteria bacterium]
MKAQTLRTFIDVHTWVGLIAGFALFIAFYAGAITVFTHELHEWDDYKVWNAPSGSVADAQHLVDGVIAQFPAARESFSLQLPGEHGPRAVLYWYERQPGGDYKTHEFRWNQGKLEEGTDQSQLAGFIYRLHYTAGLPAAWGTYVLGFVCILYGVALVTGVIMYAPSFLSDLFALRIGGNLKRLWQDAHNVIGVLSLPFHVIFAWSGAVLCIGTLLLAPFQFLVFDGKLLKIIEADLDLVAAEPATQVAETMLPVAQLIARAQRALPGLEVEQLQYTQGGDASAQVSLYGSTRSRALTSLAGVALDANTGSVLRTLDSRTFSAGTTFYRGLVSLHFGEFGHAAVRWLYFILGMAGAFLFFSGNLLWVEARRNRRSPEQRRSSRVMAQLTLGVSLGCIAGISAALVAARVLPNEWADRAHDVEIVYYSIFFASLAWALLREPSRAASELLTACALLTLVVPISDVWVTGMTPWRSIAQGQWISFVVAVLSLLFAGAFLRIARAVRRRAVHGDPNSVWAATPTVAPGS